VINSKEKNGEGEKRLAQQDTRAMGKRKKKDNTH